MVPSPKQDETVMVTDDGEHFHWERNKRIRLLVSGIRFGASCERFFLRFDATLCGLNVFI